MEELEESKFPGMSSLAEESHLAGKVKKETPILVVLGNPPYSGHSTNIGDWISKEIRAYYQVDGKPLGERNPKWLQDDYVKFIRFAQWKIDQAGEGVLGFITNHSYLDNPTFRGMRQSLMNSFDHIFFLDLHGNSLKKEKCPDGSKDENVFDIRQGVAIGLFIKKKGLKKKMVHSERWGLREEKYDWLLKNDLNTTKWKPIKPKSEYYLFVPRDEATFDQYNQYPKITEVFPANSVGIVTARDEFVIDFDKNALKRRIMMFRDSKMPDDLIRETFRLKDNRDWKMASKRKTIIADEDWEEKIIHFLYRPFDTRWIFYHKEAIDFGRLEVMRHMLCENLAIITPRQFKEQPGAFVTQHIAGHKTVSVYDINNVFPLYLYPDTDKKDLFSATETSDKAPNINSELLATLSKAYGKKPTPEEIFYYIYAVFYSNTYRTNYAEFLKTDFPRVPFTKSLKTFLEMGKYGKQLVELHLLKSSELDPPTARFQGKGDNRMEKPRYSEKEQRVYINAAQYFEGVEQEVWAYQIGGYQVLEKWLKDRKKRTLSLEDIQHYCRVATALKKTIGIQGTIDDAYPRIEKEISEGYSNKLDRW
jgi:predicted helicase